MRFGVNSVGWISSFTVIRFGVCGALIGCLFGCCLRCSVGCGLYLRLGFGFRCGCAIGCWVFLGFACERLVVGFYSLVCYIGWYYVYALVWLCVCCVGSCFGCGCGLSFCCVC